MQAPSVQLSPLTSGLQWLFAVASSGLLVVSVVLCSLLLQQLFISSQCERNLQSPLLQLEREGIGASIFCQPLFVSPLLDHSIVVPCFHRWPTFHV